jgi:hypothetical protein
VPGRGGTIRRRASGAHALPRSPTPEIMTHDRRSQENAYAAPVIRTEKTATLGCRDSCTCPSLANQINGPYLPAGQPHAAGDDYELLGVGGGGGAPRLGCGAGAVTFTSSRTRESTAITAPGAARVRSRPALHMWSAVATVRLAGVRRRECGRFAPQARASSVRVGRCRISR